MKIYKEMYMVNGLEKGSVWTWFDKYELLVPPMVIRLTEVKIIQI